MEEKIISQEEIEDYLFTNLVNTGMVPQAGDLEILSDIFMDYLFHIGVLEEIIEIDEDDEL